MEVEGEESQSIAVMSLAQHRPIRNRTQTKDPNALSSDSSSLSSDLDDDDKLMMSISKTPRVTLENDDVFNFNPHLSTIAQKQQQLLLQQQQNLIKPQVCDKKNTRSNIHKSKGYNSDNSRRSNSDDEAMKGLNKKR